MSTRFPEAIDAYPVYRALVQRIVRPDFHELGPRYGDFTPETWFDVKVQTPRVEKIFFTMKWRDQGNGNQKGQIFLRLLRGGRILAENVNACSGVAPHKEEEKVVCVQSHPVVDRAVEGDVIRVMRNVGGGGGHELHVRDFEMNLFLK